MVDQVSLERYHNMAWVCWPENKFYGTFLVTVTVTEFGLKFYCETSCNFNNFDIISRIVLVV